MFCTECGAVISVRDKFCAKCGGISSSSVVSNSAAVEIVALPQFGTPVARCWGPFKNKRTYPSGYEWVSQRNTLLICKNHLLLIKGNEKRSGSLDIVSSMGLIGGLVGVVRATKDAMVTKAFEQSSIDARTAYEKRQMIWCDTRDATIWRYERKPWMFIKSHSDQLYCKFNSMAGTIHCCLVINSTDDTTAAYQNEHEAEFPKTVRGIDFDSFFKIVVVEQNVREDEVREIMALSRLSRLPD